MATDRQIAQMDIESAVRLSGADSLASPPFQVPLGFGLAGWQHVEWGREVLVVDGKAYDKTGFVSDWMKIVGRRKYVHRVLLNPARLDVTATSLTSDQFEAALEISLNYQVINPVLIVNEQQPIASLRDHIQGMVREYIGSMNLSSILFATSNLRQELKSKFSASSFISARYKVEEVLKALPSGDERLPEVERQKQQQSASLDLIDIEGELSMKAAKYQLEIDELKMLQDDKFANRDFVRQWSMQKMELDAQLQQKLLDTFASMVNGGIADEAMLQQLRDMVQVSELSLPELMSQIPHLLQSPESLPEHSSIIDVETQGLERLKSTGEISSFKAWLNEENRLQVYANKDLLVIEVKCPNGYPQIPPEIGIRLPSGEFRSMDPAMYWKGSVSKTLSRAISTVLQQNDQIDKSHHK